MGGNSNPVVDYNFYGHNHCNIGYYQWYTIGIFEELVVTTKIVIDGISRQNQVEMAIWIAEFGYHGRASYCKGDQQSAVRVRDVNQGFACEATQRRTLMICTKCCMNFWRDSGVSSSSWGYHHSWRVYFRGNPNRKWMRFGGTPMT